MENLVHVSAWPHIRSRMTTGKVMALVLLALMPTAGFGVLRFGIRALYHILICMGTCVAIEFLYEAFTNKKLRVWDMSSLVTGLLLALSLPVHVPLWFGALGSIFAIVVVKQLFGGIGKNIFNPALAARCFLMISFPDVMKADLADAVSEATPLALLKTGELVDPWGMLLGTVDGAIGETSVIAILVGAILLLLFGVIELRIPASYLFGFSLFCVLFSGKGFDMIYLISQLCGGGLMLCAWFMATDYTTSPITPRGKVWYGLLLGVLTGVFRFCGTWAEGLCYAVLLGNLAVPFIEKVTVPRAFGRRKEWRK